MPFQSSSLEIKFASDTNLPQIETMNWLIRRVRDRGEEMGIRLFAILVASCALLSSCVDTKQLDSNSSLQPSESDHAVHGEVGAMYGHTAR